MLLDVGEQLVMLEDLTTPVYGRIGFSIVFVYLRKKGLVLGTKSSLELLPGVVYWGLFLKLPSPRPYRRSKG
ncbi:DUF91 domain-containing protein [Aeromonas phage AhSzw-1]|uniref:DUF91 domain-containing protein n=1 Tax=Aeromonas phage AhSzw-1 TaxID=2138299 RepID=A0A2R4AM48_9CAUD|nr:DUF91 domain-containing protein [Aeromonas phage AhSzw-1]AVR76117.1 DUF91 domain-containing protein [Aeromonas phage AhSzw-1]